MKACLLILGLIAQPVFAAPLGQAEFAAGTKVPAKIVVTDTIWACADARCTGPAETRSVAMQRACQSLARAVGAVSAFSAGETALAPEALQACNEKAGRGAAVVAGR